MKKEISLILLIVASFVSIALGQDMFSENITKRKINKDTLLTTEFRLYNEKGKINDSLLYIKWHENIIDIKGIYHKKDTFNYYTGGVFDITKGQIHLGKKYPFYHYDPVRVVYNFGYDTTNILNWYFDISFDAGVGRYIYFNVPNKLGGEKRLTPYTTYEELVIYLGKKSLSASLGVKFNSNSLFGLEGPDTIETAKEKISPYILTDIMIPFLLSYKWLINDKFVLYPNFGCSYLQYFDELRAYDKITNIETVNINVSKQAYASQLGCKAMLITPIRLWNWRGQESYLFLSGKYDYISAFNGINNFDLNIGQYSVSNLPFWSRGELSFIFKQSQSDWFLSRQYGLALTVMANN
jgi:hypothetical protein